MNYLDPEKGSINIGSTSSNTNMANKYIANKYWNTATATASTSVIDDIYDAINKMHKEDRRNIALMEQLYLIPVDKHGKLSKQINQVCVNQITVNSNGEYSIDGYSTRRFTELFSVNIPVIEKVIFNNPQ